MDLVLDTSPHCQLCRCECRVCAPREEVPKTRATPRSRASPWHAVACRIEPVRLHCGGRCECYSSLHEAKIAHISDVVLYPRLLPNGPPGDGIYCLSKVAVSDPGSTSGFHAHRRLPSPTSATGAMDASPRRELHVYRWSGNVEHDILARLPLGVVLRRPPSLGPPRNGALVHLKLDLRAWAARNE